MKSSNFHEKFERKEIVKQDSDKKFGIIFATFFLILAIAPLVKNHPVRLWALFFALIFTLISFSRPSILTPLKNIWFLLGNSIRKITSPVFLFILFFFVFFPLGLFLKIFKKDLLHLKFDPLSKSYWIRSEIAMTNFNDQF